MAPNVSTFVPRAGESAWTGPSVFLDATVYAFAVRVDLDSVNEVVATYLARPSHELGLPLDMRAVASIPYAFFVFVQSERGQPAREGADGALEGIHDCKLFAVVVPVVHCGADGATRLVTFAPYVYTSACPGWCADREIYGLPQQQGRVDGFPEHGDPQRLDVVARAIERFAPEAVARDTTLLTLTRRADAMRVAGVQVPAGGATKWCTTALDLKGVQAFGDRIGRAPRSPWMGLTPDDAAFLARTPAAFKERRPPAPREATLEALLADPLPVVFLKQFRDIVVADRACYQAIVEATVRCSDEITIESLGSYDLHLCDIDSAPIGRELGIAAHPVPVELAFKLNVPRWWLADARILSNPAWNPAVELSVADEPSRLPPYVDRGGESVWRQPSRLIGARIYGFGVKVDQARQQETLDAYINRQSVAAVRVGSDARRPPEPFTLRCAGLDVVLLLFVDYQQIKSGSDDDEPLGSVSYREFLMMQLAMRGNDETPALDWFIPAIYLDSDAPRLGGREIYGYPKQLGDVEIALYDQATTTSAPPRRLTLSTLAMGDDSRHHAGHQILVKIGGPEQPPRMELQYTEPSQMFRDLFELCGHADARQRIVNVLEVPSPFRGVPFTRDMQLQNALSLSNIGNVFLKEFRDCVDPHEACYKAICRTDTVPGVFQSGGRLDESRYEIEVPPHASEPLFSLLGGGDARAPLRVQPAFVYMLDLDFTLSRGRVMANALAAP